MALELKWNYPPVSSSITADNKFGSGYASEFFEGNYHLLRAHKKLPAANSPLDWYFWIRGSLVLGDYLEAQTRLNQYRERETSHPLVRSFLALQLQIYVSQSSQECLSALLAMESELARTDVLLAEYYFIRGFFHNSRDEFRKSVRFHRLAIEHYAKLGLVSHQAHALLNFAIALNNLNEKILLADVYARLEALAREYPGDVTSFPFRRLRTFRLIDREEYALALEDAQELLLISKRLMRHRDEGAFRAIGIYLCLKLDRQEALGEFLPEATSALSPMHARLIEELSHLGQIGFVSEEEGRALFRRWRQEGILSAYVVWLLDLLLEKILHSQDYENLIALSQQAQRYCLKSEQALSLTDFRYYEVIGLIRTGELESAKTVLAMYAADAEREQIRIRLDRASVLREEVEAAEKSRGERMKESSTDLFILDPPNHLLYYRGRRIDLRSKPLILNFLSALAEAAEPVAIDKMFRHLYDMEYHPFRHERRLSSLIDRSRKLLGDNSLIVRRDERLELKSGLQCRFERLPALESKALLKRRSELLRVIKNSSRPVSISELERRFSCSRRTLQFDLQSLVSTKAISRSGHTKSRFYSARSLAPEKRGEPSCA